MLKISHRGNLRGIEKVNENNPSYIMNAIYEGYDCECDIWHTDKGIFLGHDVAYYKIDYCFLINVHLWLHCKNIEAFVYLSKDKRLNLFYHTDGIALTTNGYLWTAPGLLLGDKSIAVMPELSKGWDISEAFGVCSDYLY